MKVSILFSLILSGTSAITSAEPLYAYLSDQAMDEVRGKFIEGNQITSFGIQMVSTWKDADGRWQGVAANLQGAPGYTPNLTTYTLNNSTVQSGTPTETAGMSSINGVAQVNQISGTGNRGGNSAEVVVRFDGQQLQAPTGSWTTSDGKGVTLSDNQLRVDVDLKGNGSLSQRMGNGQIGQFTRIHGDNLAVQNSMLIQVNMAPATTADTVRNSMMNSRTMMIGLPGMR